MTKTQTLSGSVSLETVQLQYHNAVRRDVLLNDFIFKTNNSKISMYRYDRIYKAFKEQG